MTTHSATRYIVPLREGGSLPAVVETEKGGAFVIKFRGAGQGARALVAELIVGGLALRAGLPVPELALIDLDASFGRSEPDPEIQDILQGSRGINVGLRYLEGSYNFDLLAVPEVDPDLASRIVWLDAYTSNIDRTPRNTNMLYHEGSIWLIDHGAALYFHHNWETVGEATPLSRFAPIRDHVLLPVATRLREADAAMTSLLTPQVIHEVIAEVPDEILMDAPAGTLPPFATPQENRDAYVEVLTRRLEGERGFVEEAIAARERMLADEPSQGGYRK